MPTGRQSSPYSLLNRLENAIPFHPKPRGLKAPLGKRLFSPYHIPNHLPSTPCLFAVPTSITPVSNFLFPIS